MHESITDKAVSMAAMIMDNDVMLSGVNDIGDASGFCDEHDQIVNDAHAMLGMLRARAYKLKRRYERAREAERDK